MQLHNHDGERIAVHQTSAILHYWKKSPKCIFNHAGPAWKRVQNSCWAKVRIGFKHVILFDEASWL